VDCADDDAERTTIESESIKFSAPLVDTNPDPDVVEVQLIAATGKQRYLEDGDATIWGYRDGAAKGSKAMVPGPLLDVEQGQRVVVHFKNELPEGTTIHWHGLPVPNASDGTPSVQVEVEPDGSFEYEFVADIAGTFWYHPHLRSDMQIERGLYGPIVVRGGVVPQVDQDRTIVLDDVKLNANGTLSESTTQLDVMLGRQGNVLLANGVRKGRMVVKHRARERWRFVNSANGRYFNLRLPGHRFNVIGWDGGLLEGPYSTDTLLIVPGERYDVLVDFPDPSGTELTLQTVYYDRGHDIPDAGPQSVLQIQVTGSSSQTADLPEQWGDAVDLDPPTAATQRELELTEAMPEGEKFAVFRINGKEFPDVPQIEARVGDVETWSVYNNSEMDHPFHLHGAFFRVLDVDDKAPDHIGWKDTVNVPRKQTLRFVVRYAEPGTWMYHCHILEHAERGMMGELQLSLHEEHEETKDR
jgi:FtsP/CotA-like multicopper oxidase with cupredoxin domain